MMFKLFFNFYKKKFLLYYGSNKEIINTRRKENIKTRI